MKIQLFGIFILFFPFQLYSNDCDNIEYLFGEKIIRICNSLQISSKIPIADDENLLYSNYINDNEILFITENTNHENFINIFDKKTDKSRKIVKCNARRGMISSIFFFALEFDNKKNKNDLQKYNLSNGEKKFLAEIPNSFILPDGEKFISDFWLDQKTERIYINLIDLSDWKLLTEPIFIAYDFKINKVLFEKKGKVLFNNSLYEDKEYLVYTNGKTIYTLDLDTLSLNQIVIRNLTLNQDQKISFYKRHGNFVILCVETKKRSFLSKIIDGRGFIMRYNYFRGTYNNGSIDLKNEIKELANMNIKHFLLY